MHHDDDDDDDVICHSYLAIIIDCLCLHAALVYSNHEFCSLLKDKAYEICIGERKGMEGGVGEEVRVILGQADPSFLLLGCNRSATRGKWAMPGLIPAWTTCCTGVISGRYYFLEWAYVPDCYW